MRLVGHAWESRDVVLENTVFDNDVAKQPCPYASRCFSLAYSGCSLKSAQRPPVPPGDSSASLTVPLSADLARSPCQASLVRLLLQAPPRTHHPAHILLPVHRQALPVCPSPPLPPRTPTQGSPPWFLQEAVFLPPLMLFVSPCMGIIYSPV